MLSLSDVGLDNSKKLYAFCYCEENVHRAIRAVHASPAGPNIETFAVVISSFVKNPDFCFPGAWLPFSRVTLVVDPTAKKPGDRETVWDYHVILLLRVKQVMDGDNSEDDESVKKEESASQIFVADFDSALCSNLSNRGQLKRLAPFADYCRASFARADPAAIKFRVIPGQQYVDSFSSTRAHMLPMQLLRGWLSDPQRRALAPPPQMLQHPPHAEDAILIEGDPGAKLKRYDLVHFINMASESPASAVSVVLDLKELVAREKILA